jgi:flagellar hook-length control protein FliK
MDSGSASAANSSSSNTARNTGKGNSASSGAGANGQAQNAAAASNKAQQNSSSQQAQAATNAAAPPDAAAQGKNQAPSFVQALAQTQADAQGSAAATVSAAPQEFTRGKPKGAKDDHTDTAGTALGLLPQSLAAAMAGLQSANAGQNSPANTSSDNESTDAVSLTSGGGASTIQTVVANLARGTAEELKAAPDGKTDPSPAPASDGSTAVASAFQAHTAQRTENPRALSDNISTPVGNAGFTDEVGDKITWMANQGVQNASLQVTPEHLGPVEVRISMQQDGTASVSFNAAHADTRAALEQALPRLREMFSTQGLTLTDASVSQQSPRGQQSQRQAVSAIGALGGSTGEESASSISSVTRVKLGLVDTYA